MLLPLYDDNPTRRWPVMTAIIVVLNVAAFLFTITRDEHQQRVIAATYGFTPERLEQLFRKDAAVRVDLYPERDDPARPIDDERRFVVFKPSPQNVLRSLITAMFLHADLLHLAGNMWFLMIFGNNIEDRLGRIVFPMFYLWGGIAASLVHSVVANAVDLGDRPMIGASGAVAVMLGAYIITFPHARVRCFLFLFIIITVIDLPAWIVLAFWFVEQFVSMKLSPALPVAFWAHIGGFVVGLAMMPLLSFGLGEPSKRDEDDRFQPYAVRPPREY
jgi:membrane associated rhomboid family serine protease